MTETTEPIAETTPTVVSSASGVDAYPLGTLTTPTVATDTQLDPFFSADADTISVSTATSRYTLNNANPQLMSVSGTDWTGLVTESYFTLRSGGIFLTPSNGKVLEANAERIYVEYDILTDKDSINAVARMMLTIDFVSQTNPKITASVIETSRDLESWQVAWIVIPSTDAGLVLPQIEDEVFSLSSFLDASVPSEELKIEVSLVPTEDNVDERSFVIDWTDASEGTLEVFEQETIDGGSTCGLSVIFEEGRAVIDPTIVANPTTDDATSCCFQRKTFAYGGYYWLFYNSGTRICYKRSADGIAWSSEFQLPSGYANVTDDGFDVAMRAGKVAVTWLSQDSTYDYLYFENGTIVGSKISWSARCTVASRATYPYWAPTVTIANDGAFWVSSALYGGSKPLVVYRSYTGATFNLMFSTSIINGILANEAFNCILAVSNGDVALLETVYDPGCTSVRWRYWSAVSGAWSSAYCRNIDLADDAMQTKYSAIADSSGTIHIAYIDNTNSFLKYATLSRGSNTSSQSTLVSALCYTPTISLDAGGTLHVFYVASGYVRHMEKTANLSPWSTPESVMATGSTGTVDSLTSWCSPVEAHALAWTEDDTTDRVKFGSIPLPFGSPGTTTEAWDREGLTPYGTYFSSLGEIVSPGSGQLTITQNDVSVSGRNGLDLSISKIYMQPKYFRTSDGRAYLSQSYPDCSMGPGWGLDLPWMNDTYVSLPGGHRFVIAWGNTGDTDVFENHDGIHFILERVVQSVPVYNTWWEITTATGDRYQFDYDTFELFTIAQTQGKDPDVPIDNGANKLFTGWESGRLSYITDDLDRRISFAYNANGMLSTVTRPDGQVITYGYTYLGSSYRLTSMTDPMGRVTYYAYNSSADYCLDYIQYPTGGKNSFVYAIDTSMGPDVRSWYVTKDIVKSSTGSLIRQTDFLYKVVGGRVTYVKQTDKNETSAVQGYTEHIFDALLNQNAEVKKDSSGAQLSKTITWSNAAGEPIKVDTYKGTSQTVNYTEYAGYDDWGNQVFSRDAIGHETYLTFANTNKENSFQRDYIMTRTTNGNIFYDCFNDWDYSDWTVDTAGGTLTLDSTADTPNAPCIKLAKSTTTAACAMKHTMTAQTTDFVFEAMYKWDGALRSYMQAFAGTSCRVNFSTDSGQFYWYTGSVWTPMTANGACAADTWYRVTFYVHPSTNKYDIYIDGSLAYSQATLIGSGNIDRVRFQAGFVSTTATSIWIDSVKVYKGLTVTTGIPTGYVAELFGYNGTFIARSVSSTLAISNFKNAFAPGYLKIWKPGWVDSVTTVTDIWGGDAYTFSAASESSSLTRTLTGYKLASSSIADDSFPGSSFAYPSDDCSWVTDANLAVATSKYHQSKYTSGSHYHGFNITSNYMTIGSTNNLIQYVYLSDGKVPAEIMIQYRITSDGKWRRAYWGDSTDIITTATTLNPTLKKWVGEMPTITGKWVQLVVKASDLGITSTSYISGVVYGLYGGTAKWDWTTSYTNGATFSGLTAGWTVTMDFGDHTAYATATSTSVTVDMYAGNVRTFPTSATVRISNGDTLIYESPELREIYARMSFTYSAANFYPNEIKDLLHAKQVGKLEYQDAARTVTQDFYAKCDSDGNVVETKTRSASSSWVYTKAAYDYYGNQLWSEDETGRRRFTEYSVDDLYTYPQAARIPANTDYIMTTSGWTEYEPHSWLMTSYSGIYYSPDYSLRLNFSNAPQGADSGTASMYKEYNINRLSSVSLAMILDTYSHNNNTGDLMDSGVKMKLYNSAGTNYATYTYWLSCWSYLSSNRTTSDPTIKVIYGAIPRNVWKEVRLYPDLDWDISWDACTKVRLELYASTVAANGDLFIIRYDDVTIDSTTQYVYEMDTGLLNCSIDALGGLTNYTYDDLGRTLSITYPKVGATRADTTYAYDDVANKVTIYDELNHKTISYFDSIGRTTKTERYNGTATYVLYSTELFGYNWQDQQSYQTDAVGRTTRTDYDYLGRATRVTNPDGTYSTSVYDDYRLTVTYSSYTATGGGVLTHRTVVVQDYLGRHNSTREYTSSSTYVTTWMTYDDVGNTLTVKDARNQITRMTYDYLDRQTSVKYPDNYTESTTYDATGRESTFTSRAGVVTTCYYDSAGRARKTYSAADTIYSMYDALDRVLLKRNGNVKTTYTYDARGNMLSQSQYMISGGATYTVANTYDVEGKILTITYPDSVVVAYTYDNMDRAYLIERQVGVTKYRIVNYTFNVDDSVKYETTGSGQQTYCHYNTRGWTDSIVTKQGVTTILSLSYTYDDVGNVKTIGSESYNYDWLNRMTSATGAWGTISYTYDDVGNRKTKIEGTTTTYSYAWYNKLSGDGTWTYAYDKDGNNFWKNSTATRWNYVFNSLDKMTSVVKWINSGGSTWTSSTAGTYSYDFSDARVRTVEGSTTTDYVYRSHDQLYEKTGSVNVDYVYSGNRLVAKLQSYTGGAYHKYYLDDALGSTRFVYNGTTQVYAVQTYKPFGIPYGETGAEKIKFAGEMQDASTSLYYVYKRYYEPETGRFLSLDPVLGDLSTPQTIHRYVYCYNNPLRFTDPTGEWGFKLPKISLKMPKIDVKTLALGVVCVAAVAAVAVCTGGAGAPFAAVALQSMWVSAAVGAGVNTAMSVGSYMYNTPQSQWTPEGFIASGVSGAVTGATAGAGIAMFVTGQIGMGMGVGAAGAEAGYLLGEMVKDAIPGGDTGHYDANKMFWEPVWGGLSVASGGMIKRGFINAGWLSFGGKYLNELPGNLGYAATRGLFGAYHWLFDSQLPSQPAFENYYTAATISGGGKYRK